ncbi:MAG TPA: hypothetical protein VGO63_04190 [Candidatus Paceibacterota bacterium]|jgi:hypothetical protein|nr:hypothetical protein [Candidatus Paceibacterota bacterium]
MKNKYWLIPLVALLALIIWGVLFFGFTKSKTPEQINQDELQKQEQNEKHQRREQEIEKDRIKNRMQREVNEVMSTVYVVKIKGEKSDFCFFYRSDILFGTHATALGGPFDCSNAPPNSLIMESSIYSTAK